MGNGDWQTRWEAVARRDASADGAFFYAVTSTGIYCYPSCPARRPRPHCVRFFDDREAAQRAGFRPCQRCRPDLAPPAQRDAELVAALCRRLEQSDEPLGLEALAADIGASPSRVQRLFKRSTGITPKAYASACRAERLRGALRASDASVTSALYRAGFNSSGRLYENTGQLLGMTPRQFRQGGPGLKVWFAVGECSLGSVLVASTNRGVCAVLLGDEPEALLQELQRRFARAELVGAEAEYEACVASVVGLIDAPAASHASLALDLHGSVFQHRVWAALSKIPPGQVRSYSEIAEAIGAPRAVRAVAGACGANPVAVAIPCHRVVRRDGQLSGYRWGIERKRQLLAREGHDLGGRGAR